MVKRFGKEPEGNRLQRIKNSAHYKNGSFRNVEATSVNPGDVPFYKILKKMAFRPSSVRPSEELPHVKSNLKELDPDKIIFVWFGHSSYFLQVYGFRILVDPVFSGYASPFRFFGKAFDGANNFSAEDIPPIDLLILTHDHYDHLDYPTIKAVHPKVTNIVTSLGVGAHLETWGVKSSKITELDWWENHEVKPGVSITATPSRHFSGRMLKRGQTLWSSFVLQLFDHNIFVGGDSGYDSTFKKIGKKSGPFDVAFLECGQYGEYWPQIHMFPEQTVQAGHDLQAKIVVPVHWGKFTLSNHPWNEPIKRFTKAAEKSGLKFISPRNGEAVDLKGNYKQEAWWEFEETESKSYETESATLG